MNARTLVASIALSLLAACAPSGNTPNANTTSSNAAASSVIALPRAGEGEACGGIAGILCEPSLFCSYDGAYPDAAGVCVQ